MAGFLTRPITFEPNKLRTKFKKQSKAKWCNSIVKYKQNIQNDLLQLDPLTLQQKTRYHISPCIIYHGSQKQIKLGMLIEKETTFWMPKEISKSINSFESYRW